MQQERSQQYMIQIKKSDTENWYIVNKKGENKEVMLANRLTSDVKLFEQKFMAIAFCNKNKLSKKYSQHKISIISMEESLNNPEISKDWHGARPVRPEDFNDLYFISDEIEGKTYYVHPNGEAQYILKPTIIGACAWKKEEAEQMVITLTEITPQQSNFTIVAIKSITKEE